LGQVQELDGRLGSGQEAAPELQLLSQTFGLADRLLGGSLILPEARRANSRVQVA
jgi:hypothetical protein